MKKTEIYTYNKKELFDNAVITTQTNENNIKYINEKTLGNIYLPNSTIEAGIISYINNLTITNKNSFNTSIGTIITNNGSMVFNFNYILKFEDSRPDDNSVFAAKPTFIDGKYSEFNDISITVQILENSGDRIIAIEYIEKKN